MSKKAKGGKELTPLHIFYTVIGYFFFVLVNITLFVFLLPMMLLSLIFDRDMRMVSYMIKLFTRIFNFINIIQRTEIDMNGLKAPKKGERRIYVINHASIFDVILMFLLPGPIKSVMKESYLKVPIIGIISYLSGNVIVREDGGMGGQLNVFMSVTEKLQRGIPVAIYPEGTRSKSGKVGRFYQGTFKMALDTEADLVPVVFDTWNVIRPGAFWIRDVRPTVKVLDTVKYEEIKDMDYKDISRMMRIKITEGLLELRDSRRERFKNYYRNSEKYIAVDNEMRSDLEKQKLKLAGENGG